MNLTDLTQFYIPPPDLDYLLPKEQEVTFEDGRLACHMTVSFDMLNAPNFKETYLHHCWRSLYTSMVSELVKRVITTKQLLGFRMLPGVVYENADPHYPFNAMLDFRLSCELWVLPSKEFIIPKIIYADYTDMLTHTTKQRPIEWRCGYCDSPNEMVRRHCSQCGAPRATLLGEN